MNVEMFLRDLAKLKVFWQKRSPTNVSILEAVESDLKSGDCPWFKRLEEIWKDHEFPTYYERPALLVDMLHYRRLLYGEDTASEPLKYLRNAPASFWKELKTSRLQTNDADRSVGWLLVSCAAFLSRSTAFHLIDLGTSAGLTLIGDYLPRDWSLIQENGAPAAEPARWKDAPYPVLSRTGLDVHPLSLSKREDRLWLEACLGIDNAKYHAHFEKAVELFLQLQKERTGPKLFSCDYEEMPKFIQSKFKPHPEEGLLIYNSQATVFLKDVGYQKLKEGLARVLAPWEDRGFWAELEFPRNTGSGEPSATPHKKTVLAQGESSEIHEFRVHRLINGRLESKVLASLTAKPKEIEIFPGWDFLRPLKPIRPPKITREEPIKPLQPGVYKFRD